MLPGRWTGISCAGTTAGRAAAVRAWLQAGERTVPLEACRALPGSLPSFGARSIALWTSGEREDGRQKEGVLRSTEPQSWRTAVQRWGRRRARLWRQLQGWVLGLGWRG